MTPGTVTYTAPCPNCNAPALWSSRPVRFTSAAGVAPLLKTPGFPLIVPGYTVACTGCDAASA